MEQGTCVMIFHFTAVFSMWLRTTRMQLTVLRQRSESFALMPQRSLLMRAYDAVRDWIARRSRLLGHASPPLPKGLGDLEETQELVSVALACNRFSIESSVCFEL